MSRFLFSPKAARARIAGLARGERQFFEHLGAEADVQLEPGYNQDEVFDDQFERRAREKTRTPSANNAVAIIPSMKGPWTANNSLGIERAFAPDENNQQTILKLPEWDMPQRWTVNLGIEYNAELLDDAGFFNVVGVVEAGSGGAIQTFEVDWADGASFTTTLNALNLVARYENILDQPLVVPDDLRLRATIGRGETSRISPTRTLRTGDIPALVGLSPFIKIPKFARRMTPINGVGISDPYAATTGYFWQAQMNTPSSIGSFNGATFLNFAPGDGIPIPPEARAIIVSNGSATTNNIRLVFHLQI